MVKGADTRKLPRNAGIFQDKEPLSQVANGCGLGEGGTMPGRGRKTASRVERQETVWNMTQEAGQSAGGRGRQEMRTERQWVMQMHMGSRQKRSYWFKKLFHYLHKYLHSVFNSAV